MNTDSLTLRQYEGVAGRCNLEGIALLQQHLYAEAIEHFYSGLQAVQAGLAVLSSKHSSTESLQANTNSQGRIHSVVFPGADDEGYRLEDDLLAVFRHPLDVPRCDFEEQSATYMHTITTALLFNIALGYHLQGLIAGDSKLLSKALDLYRMGYSSVRRETGSSTVSGHSGLSALARLAFTNNIGCIHASFWRLPEATMCSQEISRLLASLSQSSPNGRRNIALTEDDYTIFFANATFFHKDVVSASPAA